MFALMRVEIRPKMDCFAIGCSFLSVSSAPVGVWSVDGDVGDAARAACRDGQKRPPPRRARVPPPPKLPGLHARRRNRRRTCRRGRRTTARRRPRSSMELITMPPSTAPSIPPPPPDCCRRRRTCRPCRRRRRTSRRRSGRAGWRRPRADRHAAPAASPAADRSACSCCARTSEAPASARRVRACGADGAASRGDVVLGRRHLRLSLHHDLTEHLTGAIGLGRGIPHALDDPVDLLVRRLEAPGA